MSASDRFAEGDRVVHEVRVGANLPPKRHEGVVVDLGKKGVRVRFDETRLGLMWMPSNKVQVVERAKPDKPARVRATAEAVVSRAADLPPPPVELPPTVAPKPASDLDAWRAMGRDLLDGARLALHAAELELEAAEEGVRAARRDVDDALARVEKAKADLAAVERAVST